MKRSLLISLLLWLPVGALAQPVKHGDEIVEVVGADEVNVRQEKGTEGEVIAKAQRGDRLKRLTSEEGWYKVRLGDGREGWILGHYGRPDVEREVLVVKTAAIKLRRNPSMGAPEVTRAMQGDELRFLQERNNWYYVLTADGQKAWVHKDFVAFQPKPADPPPSKILDSPPVAQEIKKPDRFQEGLDFLKIGNEDRALETFQATLVEAPNHGGAHFEIGRILKNRGRTQEALAHFQSAMTGEPKRPEAQFYIEEIRKSQESPLSKLGMETRGGGSLGALFSAEAVGRLLLWGGILAGLLFLLVLLWIYRRRRMAFSRHLSEGSRSDKRFRTALREASEKRPLLRVIEEAEKKQEAAEEEIRRQIESFGGVTVEAGNGLKLPEVEPVQILQKKVEEMRMIVVEQEERARTYTDLVRLQNGKIEALNDEIEALKHLLQMKWEGEQKTGGTKKPE